MNLLKNIKTLYLDNGVGNILQKYRKGFIGIGIFYSTYWFATTNHQVHRERNFIEHKAPKHCDIVISHPIEHYTIRGNETICSSMISEIRKYEWKQDLK